MTIQSSEKNRYENKELVEKTTMVNDDMLQIDNCFACVIENI